MGIIPFFIHFLRMTEDPVMLTGGKHLAQSIVDMSNGMVHARQARSFGSLRMTGSPVMLTGGKHPAQSIVDMSNGMVHARQKRSFGSLRMTKVTQSC
jgi:ribosomal protein S7